MMRRGDNEPAIAPYSVEPAAPSIVPTAPAQRPPAGPTTVSPLEVSPSPGAAPPASEERVAPAPVEPAAPDPDRGEPGAPSGRDAPRMVGAPREPATSSQDGADTVDLTVDSIPPGAQIVLDGAVLGTTPYHGALPRGDREARLVLRLAGYADKVIVARTSQPIAERVTLVRKAPLSSAAKSSKAARDRIVNPF